MEEMAVTIIAIALMIIGSFGIIFLKKPFDKVVMFSILDAGFVLAVVLFKYLDVALFIALADPIATIVYLIAIVKIKEIRSKKVESGEIHDWCSVILLFRYLLSYNWKFGYCMEVASIGVSLILLSYNHILALLTLVAASVAMSLILFRAIIRLEEMGADVWKFQDYGIS